MIFDTQAIEAAAKALREPGISWTSVEEYSKLRATAALEAAEESMKSRGLIRPGLAEKTYEPSHDFWKVWQTNSKSTGLEFPVTIIRKETP